MGFQNIYKKLSSSSKICTRVENTENSETIKKSMFFKLVSKVKLCATFLSCIFWMMRSGRGLFKTFREVGQECIVHTCVVSTSKSLWCTFIRNGCTALHFTMSAGCTIFMFFPNACGVYVY